MKITFFIGTMMAKGGAERVFANLINYLKNDYDITLVTIWNSKIAYELEGVKVIPLDDFETTFDDLSKKTSFTGKIRKLKNYYDRIKKYKKLDVIEQSDVVISFLPEASFISLYSKKNTPVIISVRNDPKVEYKSFIYNKLMRKLYKKADGIVFQTQEAQDYFDGIINKNKTMCKIIPNPVNDNFIEKSYTGKRNKNIVSVGRLVEQKNFPLLIKAFKKFNDIHPEYTLNIYGEGNKKEELIKLIEELNLQKSAHINGRIENVKEKIYKEKMFVLPSLYEGMPNALIEALCLGIPCISTDCPCGGPRYLIENNKNGILTKVDDVDDMFNAMCKIADDEEFSKMIGKNSSKISEHMNAKTINKQWIELIEKVIRRDCSGKSTK